MKAEWFTGSSNSGYVSIKLLALIDIKSGTSATMKLFIEQFKYFNLCVYSIVHGREFIVDSDSYKCQDSFLEETQTKMDEKISSILDKFGFMLDYGDLNESYC